MNVHGSGLGALFNGEASHISEIRIKGEVDKCTDGNGRAPMRMRVVKGPISEPAPISTKQCPFSDSCARPIVR